MASLMREASAFRVAAACWVLYALVTALPVLGYPSLVAPALFRAGWALVIAVFLWFRPRRGLAILATVLSVFSLPLAFLAATNISTVGPLYLVVSAAGILAFLSSAYCWWLTGRPGGMAYRNTEKKSAADAESRERLERVHRRSGRDD